MRSVKRVTEKSGTTRPTPPRAVNAYVTLSVAVLRMSGLSLPSGLVRLSVIDHGLDFKDKNLRAEIVHRVNNLGEAPEKVLAELAARPHRRNAYAVKAGRKATSPRQGEMR